MTEYINKQALLAEYDCVHVGPPGGARKLIEEAPPADVAPVVHGRWILIAENSTGLIYYCSSCEKYINPNENDVAHGRAKEKPDYCPNCGARMDGE